MDEKRKKRAYNRLYISARRSVRKAHADLECRADRLSDESSDDESAASLQSEEGHSLNLDSTCDRALCTEGVIGPFEPDIDDLEIWDGIDNHVVESSDSELSEGEDHQVLSKDLAEWAVEFQVKHNALDALLKLLKNKGHNDLPSTARTLLKTTRDVNVQLKSSMDYVFLGVEAQIQKHLEKYPSDQRDTVDVLKISLNVDGLPLFSSSSSSLWPVLCALHMSPKKVFPVALSFGPKKPSNLDFLQDTVDEIRQIMETGIQIDGRLVSVCLQCVVCDAPAKAMVKGVKLYSGYYGCDKCTQRGEWKGRMVYPEVNEELRTDHSFRVQTQADHHHTVSPFCDLQIDMIDCFPIDYMHQVCLGVTRRLLLVWLRGKKEVRISSNQIQQVSQRLLDLQRSIPSCFSRKPRSLTEIDRWKATEYRQFLLYTGKLALKGILRQDLFDHFMTLSTAISLLVGPKLSREHYQYAHELLVYFVERSRQLYGLEFMVYNVHSMTHLARDSRRLEGLDQCSAFPFENYLSILKRMVRNGKRPLVQIIKRLSEIDSSNHASHHQKKVKVSTKPPNNAYILQNSACCEVLSVQDERNQQLLCRVYERTSELFNYPCSSVLISTFSVHLRGASLRVLPRDHLCHKAILIKDDNSDKAIFLGVLHEL